MLQVEFNWYAIPKLDKRRGSYLRETPRGRSVGTGRAYAVAASSAVARKLYIVAGFAV